MYACISYHRATAQQRQHPCHARVWCYKLGRPSDGDVSQVLLETLFAVQNPEYTAHYAAVNSNADIWSSNTDTSKIAKWDYSISFNCKKVNHERHQI